VQNTINERDLQTPTVKEEICRYSSQCILLTPKCPDSEPHGATRQQTIAKTPAKLYAYQIPGLIMVFVVLGL
jgi:hypothetical protein